LQSFSARLGIVRGRDLAQANRETYPKYINLPLWFLAEIAIAATDLAEVIGIAIGLKLLTGMPLIYGVLLTFLDTFILLYLQKLGMRKMEAFIIALVAIIVVSFIFQMIFAKPHFGEIVTGLIPTKLNNDALFIAIGIIGATVMPHNLYLHSALVQTRKIPKTFEGIKQAIKWNNIDSVVALNIAFFVNAAILILAASVFHKSGHATVTKIEEAHELLRPLLGNAAPILFAIALIAAGQSSTITGTLAGQIVMEGYLHLRLNPVFRRLLTRLIAIVPAVVLLLINGDDNIDGLLVLSQVILSLQLAFAVVPLIHFVSDAKKMGSFVISKKMRFVGWLITAILVVLNLQLIVEKVTNFLVEVALLLFVALLMGTIFYPLYKKHNHAENLQIHTPIFNAPKISIKTYNRIALALDFSAHDTSVINAAIGQGGKDAKYLLLHIVESASAKVLGANAGDYETQKDFERLTQYANYLKTEGYNCTVELGYRNRITEITRIVNQNNIQMLVIGSHGHKGYKDLIFGQTIDAVRHKLNIAIFLVSE
jgi:manganese transport protein